MPLILRRLFLATGDMVIGVEEMVVTFKVNSEEVIFDAKSILH